MDIEFLTWNDLTPNEKEQVTDTYRYIRSIEEERPEEEIDSSFVTSCRFYREAKYNYVNIII